MLTYQKRERILMRLTGAPLQFPNVAEIKFTLAPGGPFGVGELSGRLVRLGAEYSGQIMPSTGRIANRTSQRLEPISVSSVTDDSSIKIESNIFSVRRSFKSEDELLDLIELVNFGLPVAMSLQFIDAPVIVAVTGNVGGAEFIWAYANYPLTQDVTTKEIQEQRFLDSWERCKLLLPSGNRRLFAALNYFHVACRLALVGTSPWEFTAEIVVNLSKVLEVLFPRGSNGTIDATRVGLENLGYSSIDIEKWYVPVLALRNRVDAGHVSLADLSQEQLTQIQDYTAYVEKAFRQLLTLVIDRMAAGEYALPPYRTRDKEMERIVGRLAEHDYKELNLESFS